MHEIAFITTCKGRLHHIKETLPLIAALSPAEIVVVDYDCPDKTGDWVEANMPGIKVLRVKDEPGFSLPRARNLGATLTTAPWLCFIDADIRVRGDWLSWMNENLEQGYFYRAAPSEGERQSDSFGTVICPREAFIAIGGYDEAFRGWGGEDVDLYTRLPLFAGLSESSYPLHFVAPISHDDGERTLFHTVKNKELQRLINICYIEVKKHLFYRNIKKPPLQALKSMMGNIEAGLTRKKQDIPTTFSIELGCFDFETEQGSSCRLSIRLARKRRYLFFGPRSLEISAKIIR